MTTQERAKLDELKKRLDDAITADAIATLKALPNEKLALELMVKKLRAPRSDRHIQKTEYEKAADEIQAAGIERLLVAAEGPH